VPATVEEIELRKDFAEQKRRQGMALRQYRSRPEQLPFHLSRASERLLRGGVQSGKSMAWAAEISSAATGIPLCGPDGRELPFLYPRNRPLLIWVIGWDEKHIARIYRKLFMSGEYSFKIIKDRQTGEYRAWRPWEPDDAAREKETKPAPPLISESFLDGEPVWEKKGERVFAVVRLKTRWANYLTGTEIHAFASGGAPGQGEPVDLIGIDEDVKYPEHVQEWQSRLPLVRGRLIWAAWPHSSNDALKTMTRRAEEQHGRKNPDVEEWVLSFSGNPYIPTDEKRKRLEGWAAAGEAVLRARDQGQYTDDYILVYPNFNIEIVGIPRKAGPDVIEKSLAGPTFRPPATWTHYLALDPGHTNAAVVFAAVPPPEVGKFVVLYDEVFAQRCDADALAWMIAEKVFADPAHPIEFHAFIIDEHAGRMTALGIGKRIVEFYREAFEKYRLKSRLTEYGFLAGSDNIGARNMTGRNWMHVRADGTTLMRMVTDTMPHTRREFGLYRKKVSRNDVSEDVCRRENHCMDAYGYLAAYLDPLLDNDSAYYAAPVDADSRSSAVRMYEQLFNPKTSPKNFFHIGAGPVEGAA
jgi:hypothetical protein